MKAVQELNEKRLGMWKVKVRLSVCESIDQGPDAELVLPGHRRNFSPQSGLHHPTFTIAHHDNRCTNLLFAG
jgi:hypothetical protein